MLTITETNHFNVPIDACFEQFPRLQVLNGGKRILLTEGTSSVSVYDVVTGQSIKNWSFSPSAPLTCPVVYDVHSDKFVSVQCQTDLKFLSLDDDEETHDVRKMKFKRKIACLLAANEDDQETVVMYEDGHMSYLTEAINNRRQSVDVEPLIYASTITSIRVLETGEGKSFDVACVTLVDGDLCFNLLSMDHSSQVTSAIISSSSPNSKLDPNYVACNISSKGTFGGVKANGKIYIKTFGEEEHKATVNMDETEAVTGFVFFPSTDNVVGVASVSSVNGKDILTIVDLKYQTVEQVQLEREVTSNIITVTSDSIFLITSTAVVQKMYQVKEATLNSALKSRSRKADDGISSDDQALELLTGRPAKKKVKLGPEFEAFLEEIDSLKTEDISYNLSRLMKKYENIPELVLVKCLSKVVSSDGTISQTDSCHFIDLLITVPFEESKMIELLREANFKVESSIEVGNYMLSKLNMSRSIVNRSEFSQEVKEPLNARDSKIVDWITLLMNCNFRKLSVSGSTYEEKILSFTDQLDRAMKYLLASVELSKTIESLVRRQGLLANAEKYIPQYSVDKIRV